MSEIPFDHVDTIEFKDKKFCFTGNFDCAGGKKQCEQAVRDRKGKAKGNLCQKTNYLVVGRDRSGKNYINSGKTKYAMELKEKGNQILILKEEVWAKHLRLS